MNREALARKRRGSDEPLTLIKKGIEYQFYSTGLFARDMNLDKSELCKVLRGDTKTTQGYHLPETDAPPVYVLVCDGISYEVENWNVKQFLEEHGMNKRYE